MLRKYGVSSALLDLGGNVQALGSKADGSAWRVGIVMPEDQTNFCVLDVRDAAVVTSGNYERFFTADDGAVYGHILDPRTGAPVENGLQVRDRHWRGGQKMRRALHGAVRHGQGRRHRTLADIWGL